MRAREGGDPRADLGQRRRTSEHDAVEERPEGAVRPDDLGVRLVRQPRSFVRPRLHVRLADRLRLARGHQEAEACPRDHRAQHGFGAHEDRDSAAAPRLHRPSYGGNSVSSFITMSAHVVVAGTRTAVNVDGLPGCWVTTGFSVRTVVMSATVQAVPSVSWHARMP